MDESTPHPYQTEMKSRNGKAPPSALPSFGGSAAGMHLPAGRFMPPVGEEETAGHTMKPRASMQYPPQRGMMPGGMQQIHSRPQGAPEGGYMNPYYSYYGAGYPAFDMSHPSSYPMQRGEHNGSVAAPAYEMAPGQVKRRREDMEQPWRQAPPAAEPAYPEVHSTQPLPSAGVQNSARYRADDESDEGSGAENDGQPPAKRKRGRGGAHFDRGEYHKRAERRRRSKINDLVNQLHQLLPNSASVPVQKPAVFTGCIEYIRSLESEVNRLREENKQLAARADGSS